MVTSVVRRWLARAAALLVFAAGLHAEVIDRVLAVVLGDVIMQSDVTVARELGTFPASLHGPARDNTLQQLVDRALVLAEVDRYAPPEPEDAAVDRELQALRGRTTAAAFDALLARTGVTETHVRGLLRQNLRIDAYIGQRFTVAVPGDREIERFYEERKGRFAENGGVPPLERIRSEVLRELTDERRRALVADWVAGLRRRTDAVSSPSGGA